MAKSTTKQNALDLFSNMNSLNESPRTEAPKTVNRPTTKQEKPVEKREPVKHEQSEDTIPKESTTKNVVVEKEQSEPLKFVFPQREEVSMHTRSFYIEDTVYEKLSKYAKKNHVSASELLNTLLKQVL